jgi:hypothetical protein
MTSTAVAQQQPTNIVAMPNGRSGFSLAPQSLDEAMRFAEILSKSSIVPKDYQGNAGNILVAVQWGAELGLPPLQAMQNIAVINGRPSIWGDAVLALVRGSGLLESIDEQCDGTRAVCAVTRRGEPAVERAFTTEDAKRAGLLGKPGPWQQYPTRMLQLRARSWALRDVFPDVLRGVHLAEESQDQPPERDMGPAEVVKPETAAEKVKAAVRKHKPALVAPAALDAVLEAIGRADSLDGLKAAAELASGLDDAGKHAAREAYAKRRSELVAAQMADHGGEQDASSDNA